MKRSRLLLRLVGGSVLFAALAGPTPGAVGGCGQTTTAAGAAQFCADRIFWECRRDRVGGRLTEAQEAECLAPIAGCESGEGRCDCAGAAWPDDCIPAPTLNDTDACIALLRDASLIGIATADLKMMYPDCNLCGGP
ncbi:MAG: hypothetical protein IT378_05010 [Sandaracinaceae bacterium]|nr:hypothetical protein [Sandaracinaceae bacterium]MCC6873651.1 hypothetical protein [Sandaracinaceae bacterium]